MGITSLLLDILLASLLNYILIIQSSSFYFNIKRNGHVFFDMTITLLAEREGCRKAKSLRPVLKASFCAQVLLTNPGFETFSSRREMAMSFLT